MADLFPSITPSESAEELSAQDVVEIFDDEYPVIRKSIAVAGDQYDYELEVNGKSTKIEMTNWLADNMTRTGIMTLKNKAEEEMNGSD